MKLLRTLLSLENKVVRVIAQISFAVYLFSFLYAFVFVAGWSQTYDYETQVLSHPDSGCYVSNDLWAVFVVCNEDSLNWLEPILSTPFYLITASMVMPVFFVYGLSQILTQGTDIEYGLTTILFPVTILLCYLELLALLYLFRIVKIIFSKCRNLFY